MEDDDRDAILKRRNRLIAIALSGLATVGCDSIFGPCLSVVDPSIGEVPAETTDGPQLPEEDPEADAIPCLSVIGPRDEPIVEEPPSEEAPPQNEPTSPQGALPPEAQPQVCLSEIAIPDELLEAGQGSESASPRPCLRKS